MQNPASFFRNKLPVLCAVGFVVLALDIGIHLHGNLSGAWTRIHIPANSPLFSDTRGFTHAIDCVIHGQNPYKVSSFDPWHRLYNYPPIWLLGRYLGISSGSSNLIGFAFAVAGISAYLFLFNARTLLSGVIVFFAVASHCVLLSIERGNTDQIVFFLLVFGFFFIHRQRPELRSRLTGALIVLLTILKIYPMVAATVFLQRRRGWIPATLTVGTAIGALLITSGHALTFVIANTPRDPDMSFGAFPFLYSFTQHTMRSLSSFILQHRIAAPLTALLIGGVCFFAGTKMNDRLHDLLPPLDSNQTRGAIAIVCLSIFCFAFIAGSSYDYRLIYLTGALAWLVEDIDKGNIRRSLPAALLILILLWKPFWLSITGELFDGLVFLMSSVWLGNALFARGVPSQSTSLWYSASTAPGYPAAPSTR
ncbi:MAG TPA: hypothetical protein VGG95_14595 [Edaphobacter sp.]